MTREGEGEGAGRQHRESKRAGGRSEGSQRVLSVKFCIDRNLYWVTGSLHVPILDANHAYLLYLL
eukprot:scaffold63594_cov26-Tisochrysis_lutea.AAC.1